MISCRALEHIAQLEQRNALKRGRFLTLFSTHAVQSLNKEERQAFFDYLRGKKIKNFFTFVSFIFFAVVAFTIHPGLTGYAFIGNISYPRFVSLLFLILLAIFVIYLFISKIKDHRVHRRFSRHAYLVDKAIK